MGWKIVRDGQRNWCKAHGVSGSWRTATREEAIRALARKLTEEAAEYTEGRDPQELWDLQDALAELMHLTGADDASNRLVHLAKLEELGGFAAHLMWSPVPGDHP